MFIVLALYFAGPLDTLASMVIIEALSAFLAVSASMITLFRFQRRSRPGWATSSHRWLGIAALTAVMVRMSLLALDVEIGWIAGGGVVYAVRDARARLIALA